MNSVSHVPIIKERSRVCECARACEREAVIPAPRRKLISAVLTEESPK